MTDALEKTPEKTAPAVQAVAAAPAARRLTGRAVLVAALLAGGAVFIIYGAVWHRIPVLSEQPAEVEYSDFAAPPVITAAEIVVLTLSEPEATRDVSVGGLALNDRGEVQRTYTGEPPAACPT